jgi:hypothetical protein
MHRGRTYNLKCYCEIVDINFKEILSHSRATWLHCHGTITADFSCHKLISFLSQPNLPTIFKFSGNDLAEMALACHNVNVPYKY